MIVWGGNGACSTGGIYDPRSDTWRLMSSDGAPEERSGMVGFWTGSELLLYGGACGHEDRLYATDGALYSPD
jgi:hypothetical protein